MLNLYNGLARFVSYLFPLTLFEISRRFFKKIYWYAYSRRFKAVGNGSFIEYPFLIRGPGCIEIGSNTVIAPGLRLDAIERLMGQNFAPEIRIGNNVSINFDCHIGSISRVTIGDNTLIAGKVFISDHTHGDTSHASLQIPPQERQIVSRGPVSIGKNVWIGESVCILPNIVIGDNAVIGANSVVTKSVLPNTIVAGIPARVIKSHGD